MMGGGGGGEDGITADTKILGHLTANSKKFAVTVKINK